jgi:AcrR family transcriptional regulator
VAAHQRARLLRAVGEVCAERGWTEATVADVVRAAGVSQRTFYRHFESKEQCFLAAFEAAVAEARGWVLAALAPARRAVIGDSRSQVERWPALVGTGLRALLDELGAHPALARILFVDALYVGGEALRRRERTLVSVRERLPVPAGAPPQAVEATLGGVVETIYHTVLAGNAAALPAMADELLYCLLVPLIGHERAWAASRPAATQMFYGN